MTLVCKLGVVQYGQTLGSHVNWIISLQHLGDWVTFGDTKLVERAMQRSWMKHNYVQMTYRCANVFRLALAFTVFGPLRQWCRRYWKFTWQNCWFTEGERTRDLKDGHLCLVVVTYTALWLYLGNLWPISSQSSVLWASRKEEGGTVVSLVG